MSKYDFELKLKIVRENEEGYGKEFLSKKYRLKKSTIKNWIIQFKLYEEEGLRKSMSKTKYTGEFKLSVLKYRQFHKLFYTQTAEHFQINNSATIANWQRKYNERGFEVLNVSIGRPTKSEDKDKMPKNTDKIKKLNKSEREELIELRQKNEYLEAEILYLKKLDALIRKKKSLTKKKPK